MAEILTPEQRIKEIITKVAALCDSNTVLRAQDVMKGDLIQRLTEENASLKQEVTDVSPAWVLGISAHNQARALRQCVLLEQLGWDTHDLLHRLLSGLIDLREVITPVDVE